MTPHLKDYPDVATVIERFEELYPGFTEGQATARHESLAVSLSFSLRRLSDAAQERLPALGVFAGGALDFMIPMVAGMEMEEWAEARETFMGELIQAGLVTAEVLPFPIAALAAMSGQTLPPGMDTEAAPVPYYRFHPTLAPHLRRRLSDADRQALEARYRQAYYELSLLLYHADSRSPHQARAVAARELPNLRRALDLALDAGDPAAAAFADNVERFLNVLGRWREREAMMARVQAAVGAQHAAPDAPLTYAAFLLESRQGELLLDQGRARDAEALFRRLLARMLPPLPAPPLSQRERGPGGEGEMWAYNRAQTLRNLGRSLARQGRPGQAEAEYRRALEVLAGLAVGADPASAPAVRRETGAVHTDLADVLRHQGRYPEAREHYQAALEIDQALGDERGAAVVLGQLGALALMEGDHAEAARRYREALAQFRALGETRSQAICLYQLGRVAEEAAGRAAGPQRAALLQEAEAAYQESLRLEEALGDAAGAAKTANQLAIVAQLAGRPADAERWYRRAIELDSQVDNPKELAIDYNNLAFLLLSVHGQPAGARPPEFAGRDLLAEAERWARQAVEIDEAIGDPSVEIWKDYSILAGIAEARGDGAGARAWRRQERAAFLAFPGGWARLERQWGPVVQALAAAAQPPAGSEPAGGWSHGLLDQLAQTADWRNLAAALRRVLAGARDADALADELDLDRTDYLILRKAVEAVEALAAPPGGGLQTPAEQGAAGCTRAHAPRGR